MGLVPPIHGAPPNVLRMPLKFSNTSYVIPRQLEALEPVIRRVAEYEKYLCSDNSIDHDDTFCHITYDSSTVNAGEYHRFPGFHGDGIQGTKLTPKVFVEHSYILTSAPLTEFCLQPFFLKHLDEAKHNYFLEFDRQAKETNVYGSLPNHLYLIDPYIVPLRSNRLQTACSCVSHMHLQNFSIPRTQSIHSSLVNSMIIRKKVNMNGAIYVSDSGNTKIMGSKKVDATYASIKHTCPSSCPLKDEGCYAQTSFVGMINLRMQRRAKGKSAIDVARSEAKAIDNSYNGGPVPQGRALRLHVAGDSRTLLGTRIINKAIKRWKNRGGGSVWSYTHAWKHIPREEWSNASVLASIQNTSEVEAARAQGYAPAIVVDYHKSDKAYQLAGSDTKFIPCPNQTRGVGCSDCKLCFNADRLFATNMGIAFAAHGVKKEQVKRHLTVLK